MNQCIVRALIRQVELRTATFMASQQPHGVQIDHIHSSAICEEIGERLGYVIPVAPARLPSHLLCLTARLDRIERGSVLKRLRLRFT